MGTFHVLKLPLGFIRVLEWVSYNFGVFFPTPDTFIDVKQSEQTYMQRLIAASVSTRVFAFRVHKLVQLYRIGSGFGAGVYVGSTE